MPKYALILAGGRGERFRPLTDQIPKPMVRMIGKPLLWYQVQWLKQSNITDVVFLAGYRWNAIQDYFGDGNKFDINAHYSIDDSPLGRGGAIRRGLALVPPDVESVVALNGDTLTTQNLDAIITLHREKKANNPAHLATIMVVPMVSPYGLVEMNKDNRVVALRRERVLPYWINAGIYVLDRQIEPELPEVGDQEVETFPKLAKQGRIAALKSRALWWGIDSPAELQEATKFYKCSAKPT
jgi:NDP-sugar pyrophosphorylase family protein